MPTPEQSVGHLVRLLRQGRDWSQQELAQKMRAYGYEWSQATVTRLEAASRPIRVNELADLALLFGVPVSHFLDPRVPGWNDLEEPAVLEREIADATEERARVQAEWETATQLQATLASTLASLDGRLALLERWHSRSKAPRAGDLGEPAQP